MFKYSNASANSTEFFHDGDNIDNESVGIQMENVDRKIDNQGDHNALKLEHLSPINASGSVLRDDVKTNEVVTNKNAFLETSQIMELEKEILDLDKKLEKLKHVKLNKE